MRVTGLDLSLSRTGVCWATAGNIPRVTTVSSKPDDGTIEGRSIRLRSMVQGLWPYVQGSDLLVVEQPSYGSTGGKAHDRSGLWWMLVGRATGAGIPVVEVAPGTVKVYATGKGRGDKDEVLAEVVRRWPAVQVRNNDEADALMLACMGLRAVGQPYDDPPQTHQRAMRAVRWPDLSKGADR